MPKSDTKQAWITFRLDPKLKRAAEKAARADDRSLTGWLVRLIRQATEKKSE